MAINRWTRLGDEERTILCRSNRLVSAARGVGRGSSQGTRCFEPKNERNQALGSPHN